MNTEEKLVSVIIPVFNVEKYIERCLASVINQTYKNIEVIVVDDGSSDGTHRIASDYIERDSRVKLITKNNRGVSDARNCGLRLVTGEYVYFLDGDDRVEENAIEKLVEAAEETGSDLVGCQYSRWNEAGERLEDYSFKDFDIRFSNEECRINFITDELLKYNMGFEVWNKLYRTKIIKKGDVCFDEKCSMGEDLSFNIKYILNCNTIKTIPDRCVRYLIRKGSAMSKKRNLQAILEQNLLIYSDVWEYINNTGKKEAVKEYGIFFIKGMNFLYSKRSAREISRAINVVENKSFAVDRYREIKLKYNRKKIETVYSKDHGVYKFMYHLYIKCFIGAGGVRDKVLIKAYQIYRKLKGAGDFKDVRLNYW